MGVRPVFPLLMSMALPAMLSMFIQSMYNVVDSMFVARISDDALTAVSLAFPIQNFILAVAVGTGVGVNSLISRKLGEKNRAAADSAVTHGLILAVSSAVLFIIAGLLLIRPFFSMFTDSAAVQKLGCDYTYIVTLLSFGTLIHICVEKILQATGNMVYPMVFQAVGAVINIILDPILIFGWLGFPKLGVTGAALATVTGQITAMLLAVIVLLTKKHDVGIKGKGFRFSFQTVRDIYTVGVPSILMMSIGSLLVMGLNSILIQFSNLAVSLFGIYFKLQSFVFMPVSGLTQGAMPIMGYNYGAKNKKRLLQTLDFGLLVSGGIMLLGTLIFCAFPEMLLGWFHAPKEMLTMGVPALRIISLSFLFAAVGTLFATLFQAIGRGGDSLVITLLRQLVIILPLSFLLTRWWGLTGVWVTFPIAEGAAALLSLLLFLRCKRRELREL